MKITMFELPSLRSRFKKIVTRLGCAVVFGSEAKLKFRGAWERKNVYFSLFRLEAKTNWK